MNDNSERRDSGWAKVRAELLADGKADLVEAIEDLIREGQRQETERLLTELRHRTLRGTQP